MKTIRRVYLISSILNPSCGTRYIITDNAANIV